MDDTEVHVALKKWLGDSLGKELKETSWRKEDGNTYLDIEFNPDIFLSLNLVSEIGEALKSEVSFGNGKITLQFK